MSTSCVMGEMEGGGVDVFFFFSLLLLGFSPSFPLHASFRALNSHLSAHLQGCFECWLHSHPRPHHPREMPHMQSRHRRPEMCGSLWRVCVCAHLSAGSRGVSGCVCARVSLAALTHKLPNAAMLAPRTSHDQFFSQSLTHNKKNLINWTAFTLNRSKSHFNGIGLV